MNRLDQLSDALQQSIVEPKEEIFNTQFIKTKNFIFAKKNSLRFQKNKSRQFTIDNISKESNFIPKIKNKQLLSDPKFFISLERKKIKLENSKPSFQRLNELNPEMRGSKIKNDYKRIFFQNKSSILKLRGKTPQQNQRNTIFSRKSSSFSTESLTIKDTSYKQRFMRNFSEVEHIKHKESDTQLKKAKRPNVYENLNFMIRRRKQLKNKVTINKLSQSKQFMTINAKE